jgi:hypothetical protein
MDEIRITIVIEKTKTIKDKIKNHKNFDKKQRIKLKK